MDQETLYYLRDVLLSTSLADYSRVGLHNSDNHLRLLFSKQMHFSIYSALREGSRLEIAFLLRESGDDKNRDTADIPSGGLCLEIWKVIV